MPQLRGSRRPSQRPKHKDPRSLSHLRPGRRVWGRALSMSPLKAQVGGGSLGGDQGRDPGTSAQVAALTGPRTARRSPGFRRWEVQGRPAVCSASGRGSLLGCGESHCGVRAWLLRASRDRTSVPSLPGGSRGWPFCSSVVVLLSLWEDSRTVFT